MFMDDKTDRQNRQTELITINYYNYSNTSNCLNTHKKKQIYVHSPFEFHSVIPKKKTS